MDYKETALYVLAGYGIYVAYQKYVAKTQSSSATAVIGDGTIAVLNPQSQADCPKDTRFVMGRHGERSCRDFRKTCPKGSEFAVVDTFVGEKCRCPDGMVRKPVFIKAGAYQTLSAEAYMVEKRNFNERQVNAPCITEAEAEMIRITQPK
jgi:hypothetical protein